MFPVILNSRGSLMTNYKGSIIHEVSFKSCSIRNHITRARRMPFSGLVARDPLVVWNTDGCLSPLQILHSCFKT